MIRGGRRTAGLTGLLLTLALLGVAPAGADGHSVTHEVISGDDGTPIALSIFKPAGASAADPVPMILHSHGWGGSRTTEPDAFAVELERGFGVVSFDQRGFGESGGRATVQNPDKEGTDVARLVDRIAALDWVALDAPGDPVLFGMGGSYGGGFQWIGALTEIRDSGATRFDGLAPEISWYDLPESLAPARVARSTWLALLYAAGLDAHEDDIHTAFAYGSATGQWPDGTVTAPGVPNLQERFGRNGPNAFVAQGIQLDIPVLIGQGSSDNLFNLNQGWKNFQRTLTGRARSHSVFIGYNGGHALPSVVPPGEPMALEVGTNVDTCSPGGFRDLRLAFFERLLEGKNPRSLVGGSAYSVMTVDGRCVRVESLDADTAVAPSLPGLGATAVTTTGAGAPQHLPLAAGPLTVAGIPELEADVTTVGVDQRVFLGLSVGTSPADARLVHNNVMPLREVLPVIGERRSVELAGMAVDVAEGERLFLTVTPVSDLSFGHGSARTPGAVTLANVTVRLPVVE